MGGSALAICGASAPGAPGTGPTTLWPPQPTTWIVGVEVGNLQYKENIKVITWGGGTARVTRNLPFWEGILGGSQ